MIYGGSRRKLPVFLCALGLNREGCGKNGAKSGTRWLKLQIRCEKRNSDWRSSGWVSTNKVSKTDSFFLKNPHLSITGLQILANLLKSIIRYETHTISSRLLTEVRLCLPCSLAQKEERLVFFSSYSRLIFTIFFFWCCDYHISLCILWLRDPLRFRCQGRCRSAACVFCFGRIILFMLLEVVWQAAKRPDCFIYHIHFCCLEKNKIKKKNINA